MRLIVIGNPAEFHVGYHLKCAAEDLQWECQLLDSNRAYGRGLWQKLLWRLDRLPSRLVAFEREVLRAAEQFRPDLILSTGCAPLRRRVLESLGGTGCTLANFSTDDPWNPHHRAKWFLAALPGYDHLFSPRQANIEQLQSLCLGDKSRVHYLPFGYNPRVHFVDSSVEPASGCDVLLVGGADQDRVPYARALLDAGLSVTAFGGYWKRWDLPGLASCEHADANELRKATRSAMVNLILVRRANRDGHVMRTYEAWASGGCLLVEDTEDHRSLFGAEKTRVLYFRTPQDAVHQVALLKSSDALRVTMLKRLHDQGALSLHAYPSRLNEIEQVVQRLSSICAGISGIAKPSSEQGGQNDSSRSDG